MWPTVLHGRAGSFFSSAGLFFLPIFNRDCFDQVSDPLFVSFNVLTSPGVPEALFSSAQVLWTSCPHTCNFAHAPLVPSPRFNVLRSPPHRLVESIFDIASAEFFSKWQFFPPWVVA